MKPFGKNILYGLFVPSLIFLAGCGGGGGGGSTGGGTPAGIGPNGGTVASSDGKASVTIPAGALSQETAITVNTASSPPAGNIGTAYEFGPSGTAFSQPVTISVTYNQADLPSTVTESSLKLGTLVNNQWAEVTGSTVDVAAHSVTGTTTHFSVYGVIPRAWRSVTIETGIINDVGFLAVDTTGRAHVIYGRATTPTFPYYPSLKYATCASECLTATNWTSVTITSDAGQSVDQGSIAVDANGTVHFVYYKGDTGSTGSLVYWSCASNCTAPSSWSTVTIDNTGTPDATSSLAIDSSGRLHVSYYKVESQDCTTWPCSGTGTVKYATCAGGCTNIANWAIGVIGEAEVTGGNASGVTTILSDSTGRLHVSYNSTGSDLTYATCSSNCTIQTNWASVDLGIKPIYSSMGIDDLGRLHLVLGDLQLGFYPGLQYATCTSNCTVLANWSFGTVDESSEITCCLHVAMGADGTVHLLYPRSGGNPVSGPWGLWYSACSAQCTVASNWDKTQIEANVTWSNGPINGSIVVDPSGGVHIVYSADHDGGALTYAHY
jgi:hypothetical protein